MLTFKQLIIETEFSKVWQKFLIHYPQKSDRENKFARLYEKLKLSDPLPNKTNMHIYINVFEDDENGDTVPAPEFIEDDPSYFFDVCGRDDEWTGYSLAACKFREWLEYFINKNSPQAISPESFIAHCLWEMTFYFGFDDSKAYE